MFDFKREFHKTLKLKRFALKLLGGFEGAGKN